VIGAVGALHLLRDRSNEAARVMFSMAMWMAAIVAPMQIVAGDFHGLNTLEHQSTKIAAMEGHFETHPGAPLILFGIPNEAEGRIDYKVQIPNLGAFILTHDWNGVVRGLNEWPKEERPPVAIVFWSFRVMVAIGFLMLGLGIWSLWARWRGRIHDAPWLHRAAILMGPSGFAAVLAGWITTEVGRQPWTVQGLLNTAQSASPIDAAAIWRIAGRLRHYIFRTLWRGHFFHSSLAEPRAAASRGRYAAAGSGTRRCDPAGPCHDSEASAAGW
jgi:cytochrome d ubiquinol oxidase subunit I